jgi:signal transduction histidine kinase
MTTKPPRVAISPNAGGGNWGYTVLAGTYGVRINKNGTQYIGDITINEDKKSIHKPQDRIAQNQAMKKLWTMIDDLAFIAEQTTATRDSLKLTLKNLQPTSQAKNKTQKAIQQLDSLHKTMIAEKSTLFADTEDKLREKLASIYGTIAQYAGKPSDEQQKRIGNLEVELINTRKKLNDILLVSVKDINTLLKAENINPITILTREQFDNQEQ